MLEERTEGNHEGEGNDHKSTSVVFDQDDETEDVDTAGNLPSVFGFSAATSSSVFLGNCTHNEQDANAIE